MGLLDIIDPELYLNGCQRCTGAMADLSIGQMQLYLFLVWS